ncbi:hypothetical protein G6F43_007801 [Rhizopus delemar]|nr:hypothetical protein G6F43_007801 [Rhizopus delemar]
MWHLYLTQGLLSGIGASLVWFPCISAAQQWFSKRRGLSVGIAISGSGFGGLVLANVVQAAMDRLGHQWALRIVGFISFVCLSIAACTVRPLNEMSEKNIKVFDLTPFRNKQFILLFCVQFIGNFAFNVPSSFLPAYADYLHLNPWIGTNMSAIISGVMIVGKISSGWISDYVGRANMTFFVTTMTGVMCLAVWLPAKNAATVWAFAALFGYFGGGHLTMVPALLGQVVGMEDIEAANGLLFFAWFFGGLFGSPICSVLIDEKSGNPRYDHAIIFGGVLMIFAGLLAWTILAFLGASISLLTFQLDSIVPISRLIGGGSSAYASGYIILIIIQFIWVMIFGSDPESFVGQYGPCHYSNNNAVGVHQPQYEMGREEKTTLSDPVIEQPQPPPTTTTTAAAAAAAAQATAVPSPTTVEYRERVQALHAYQANPEDPNELSFSKGEILEIVDRNGNWWQARKSDGTEGIIPSNYFAPSS